MSSFVTFWNRVHYINLLKLVCMYMYNLRVSLQRILTESRGDEMLCLLFVHHKIIIMTTMPLLPDELIKVYYIY